MDTNPDQTVVTAGIAHGVDFSSRVDHKLSRDNFLPRSVANQGLTFALHNHKDVGALGMAVRVLEDLAGVDPFHDCGKVLVTVGRIQRSLSVGVNVVRRGENTLGSGRLRRHMLLLRLTCHASDAHRLPCADRISPFSVPLNTNPR